jgi:hypothetical protein
MQKVRRHSLFREFQLLIELLIHVLFHQSIPLKYKFYSLLLAFQIFPLQYFALLLNLKYLALEDGSPVFRQVNSHRTYSYYYITTLQDSNTFYSKKLHGLFKRIV